MKKIILLAVLLMSNVSANADLYEPVPQCYEPKKLLWLASNYYTQRYEHDVEKYQECIKSFVKKQRHAAHMHTQAAENAVKILNDYIKEQ